MFSITCLKGKEEKGQKLPSRSAIYVLIYVSIISLTTYFSSEQLRLWVSKTLEWYMYREIRRGYNVGTLMIDK